MSRDGQIMLKLAKKLNEKFKLDLDLRYLYVSRQALLLPAIDDIGQEELEWILAPTTILTTRIILRRLNIDVDDVAVLLNEFGISETNYDRKLSKREVLNIGKLITDGRFKKKIFSNVEFCKPRTIGYLKQEGLTEDENFAVIDIGWQGTLQKSISRILHDNGHNFPVKGLYFWLKRRLKYKESDDLQSYFPDRWHNSKFKSRAYIIPMMEAFVAADHGGVVSYDLDGESYRPVLKSHLNAMGIDWGISVQQEAMQKFAELITSAKYNMADNFFECQEVIADNFAAFMLSPTLTEASVYGQYPDSEDQYESYHLPLAEKYSFTECIKHRLFGYKHHHNEWSQASVAMSNGLGRRLGR